MKRTALYTERQGETQRFFHARITTATNNKEKEKIKNDMESIYQQWEQRHDKLAYFIEHDELEKVETEFVAIKSYIETDEYEEAISELDKSVFILKHIEDKYAFNLQNVF